MPHVPRVFQSYVTRAFQHARPLSASKGNHLHICTFSHLHISSAFAHSHIHTFTPMLQLLLNNKPATIKTGTTFKLNRVNPYFDDQGDYTFEVQLPLQGSPQILAIFGPLHRPELSHTHLIGTSLPFQLIAPPRHPTRLRHHHQHHRSRSQSTTQSRKVHTPQRTRIRHTIHRPTPPRHRMERTDPTNRPHPPFRHSPRSIS